MSPRKRLSVLLLIMAFIVIVVESITIGILYHTALMEERSRLQETAKSQARLIEAIARFDKIYSTNYPYGAGQATLSQIRDAHAKYSGFGETGEFTLSKRENDNIVFLLNHRHYDLSQCAEHYRGNLEQLLPSTIEGKWFWQPMNRWTS